MTVRLALGAVDDQGGLLPFGALEFGRGEACHHAVMPAW
jgi:hypothetical protein